MKFFLKSLLLLLFSGFLALQPTLAHAHGDGSGGGGSSGGGGDGDGDAGAKMDANPEKDKAPDGFADHKTAPRTYAVTAVTVSPIQKQFLHTQGYVSEAEQRERGDGDWSMRATQKSQTQWNKHSATAYDVAAKLGGVTLADVNAMSARQANAAVPHRVADAAWSMAVQKSGSVGKGVATGLGGVLRDAGLSSARQTGSLKNLAEN